MSYANGGRRQQGHESCVLVVNTGNESAPAGTPGSAALYNPITRTVLISFERNPKTTTTARSNVADINFPARVLMGDTRYR